MHPEIAKHIVTAFLLADVRAEFTDSPYGRAIEEVKVQCTIAHNSGIYGDAATEVVAFYNRFW